MRLLGIFLLLIGLIGLGFHALPWDTWKAQTIAILKEAQQAGFEEEAWEEVYQKSQALPSFYPFSTVKAIIAESYALIKKTHQFSKNASLSLSWKEQKIDPASLEAFFQFLSESERSLKKIIRYFHRLPTWAMDRKAKAQWEAQVAWLEFLAAKLEDAEVFYYIFQDFLEREEEVLVLLQNPNEPRSTGGFVGSLLLFSFHPEAIKWKFLDIYAIDRLIPPEATLPAPAFFHPLSKVISLRDANMHPDFAVSAKTYQYFFKKAGLKVPNTIIATDFYFLEYLLKHTGPITFPKWGVTVDAYNFDLVLQFLVESKIMGRYQVKTPILLLGEALFQKLQEKPLSWVDLASFPLEDFLAHKHLLAYSSHKPLQRLFEKWRIDGRFHIKPQQDLFLHFDFISVGANKSEKFVWTKLSHNTEITPAGEAIHTLTIKRTHALKSGEIQALLKTHQWFENVKALLTPDLLWKLGAGESRVMLRLWLPKEVKFLKGYTPSGKIIQSSEGEQFSILHIPLNVLPGESLQATLQFSSPLKRGSHNWRPYFLQLIGTPARKKTTYLPTISLGAPGSFEAQTINIGRPTDLIDQDYRLVVRFAKALQAFLLDSLFLWKG